MPQVRAAKRGDRRPDAPATTRRQETTTIPGVYEDTHTPAPEPAPVRHALLTLDSPAGASAARAPIGPARFLYSVREKSVHEAETTTLAMRPPMKPKVRVQLLGKLSVSLNEAELFARAPQKTR